MMKSITFHSPAELKEKVDKLLKGYENATAMQVADLKKRNIPHHKTRYDIQVDLRDVAKVCPKNVKPQELLNALLEMGTRCRQRAEHEAGVMYLRKKEPVAPEVLQNPLTPDEVIMPEKKEATDERTTN